MNSAQVYPKPKLTFLVLDRIEERLEPLSGFIAIYVPFAVTSIGSSKGVCNLIMPTVNFPIGSDSGGCKAA